MTQSNIRVAQPGRWTSSTTPRPEYSIIADELVNMIIAQRSYEINAKAIQAADDMLQVANNLKR